MDNLNKLEEERQIMKGNWGDRNFINAFEVMLENSKNFEIDFQRSKCECSKNGIYHHDSPSPKDQPYTCNVCGKSTSWENPHYKYQIIESLGKILKSASEAGMDVTEIFSMYQVLSWSKGENIKSEL
jgi:hypothetical protein